jgi:signal transduction histidine kinase
MTAVRTPTTPPADDALARVAHELRGPLACIIHALRGVPPGDRAVGQARGIAERQAWRATRIVEDLFDVCAGGQGKLTLRKEWVSLAGVVWRAVETAEPQLVAAGLRVTLGLPSDPPELHADPLRLEQVFANLLTNAAKFTQPGGHVRVTAEADAGHVTVRVRDTGRGIPPALLPHVFDPFVQEPGACRQGLGLGLAVVKSLVEAHGGTVTAASDGPGTGAEFTVRLPRGSTP